MKIRKLSRFGLSLNLLVPAGGAAALGVGACATTRPMAEQTDDRVITGRVGRSLTADPEVQRYDIGVDTFDGVVYLRGSVDSASMKTSAEQIASSTEGVRKVVNEIIIETNAEGAATVSDPDATGKVGDDTARSMRPEDSGKNPGDKKVGPKKGTHADIEDKRLEDR